MVDSMIRIFGSALDTNTSFTSNGLGVLSEAISCSVTEERNGAFELEMEYPITGSKAEYLQLRNIIVCKSNPFSNPQPFRIYSISKPINGVLSINAEHISYDLNGYVAQVLPKNSKAKGLKDYFTKLKESLATPSDCPFTFETNSTSVTEFRVSDILPIRTILGNRNGYSEPEEDPSGRIIQATDDAYILDKFNGEYEWDGLNVKHYYINPEDGRGGRGSNNGVSIRYGKNLVNFKQDENCQNVYTGIYPYWHYDEYRHDLIELPEKYILAEGTYDYVRILPMDLTSVFPRRPSDDDMREYVTKYMKDNDIGTPKVSFDVEFLPLAQTEEYKDYAILETVKLCDTVSVVFPLMNVSASSKVVRTVYNPLSDKYTSISLGEIKNGISDMMISQKIITSQKTNSTILEKAVTEATNAITGNSGGNIVLDPPNNPTQIMIMDSDSKTEARNVWRWTQGGLGHSSSGIDGPYSDVALTADGQINANYITVGELSGDRIKAGTITSSQISVGYTNDMINAFTVADGELRTHFESVSSSLDGKISNTDAVVSELSQSFRELNASFTERFINGINKIQNSAGLNGVEGSNWIKESGTRAYSEEDSYTDSGSAIVLDTVSIYQTVQLVAGEYYTLTLKYKNLTTSGSTVSIIDGENETVVVTSNVVKDSWNVYNLTFKAGSSSIKIKLQSSGNKAYVSDIMLAPGKIKQNWTPAPNEIYTTNVKIDRKGINISNNESNTQTIIDNTQFAVKHNNEIVLTVNKDQTTLRKTEVTDEFVIGDRDAENSDLGKLAFVPVTGGVDLVLLD